MVAVSDRYTPHQTWEEKVSTAMRSIHLGRHRSKDGVPLGPVYPRLACNTEYTSNRELSSTAKPQRGKGSSGLFRVRSSGSTHRDPGT